MSLESVPPKYAQLVQTLQRRIESGTYPPGSLLPSENQLIQEFGVSRPTVVAALRVLREQGWIESQQGKGRFVRGRPAREADRPRTGQAYLTAPEDGSAGELLEAGVLTAPNRVAALLGLPAKGKAFVRRRLISRDGEPAELVSVWVPSELAQGTDLTSAEPLTEGIADHLSARKALRPDHVVEQITARMPGAEESRRLGMGRSVPLLAVYGTVRDASGQPLAVAEVLLPADRHELEDAYPIG